MLEIFKKLIGDKKEYRMMMARVAKTARGLSVCV